ncbi:hypothetical protein PIB30_078844 [Stylosanthes scabra]|uniref:Uncharacterized protein n=1 Tax=Stylosanthes scabra TaxID=79078 RepID=A0ABU6TQJ0_9FABA|nr:hypothetical protein [Stylosanthes scabra]
MPRKPCFKLPTTTDAVTAAQTEMNLQFRLPHNEARPTQVAVPQVPAAHDYSRSRADMDDSNSGDLDYYPWMMKSNRGKNI